MPLAAILQRGHALALAQRAVSPTLLTQSAALARGAEASVRIQLLPESTDIEVMAVALAAFAALRVGGIQDDGIDALAADALLQIRAAWALQQTIVSQPGQHLPLKVRIERVTTDGCRLFHVDQLVLRMICTWHGPGSEWLPERAFDRAGLGCGCNDHVHDMAEVRRIPTTAVAVMKGDCFPGESGHGLVHRSPPASPDQPRMLMVIDIA